jgi:hypothetical protein
MSETFVTTPQLCHRYHRTPRTLARWMKNPPEGFPEPVKLNGRNLWPLAQIEKFERFLASKSGAADQS